MHPNYPWKQEHDEKMRLGLSMQQWQDRIFGWASRLGLYDWNDPRFEEQSVGHTQELNATSNNEDF